MRASPAETKSTPQATGEGRPGDPTAALTEMIERMSAKLNACEAMGDPDLARHTGRTLLAVVACATDALLRDGGVALQSAPDKFGAFFDKAAAGYVQAIEGLHKRAALADLAATDAFAPGGPRRADPTAISPWGLAAQRWRAERTASPDRE
jgi:hypothetical protein